MRLKIFKENSSSTQKFYDLAGAILKDENDQQTIQSWMDTDISITVTSSENNQNQKCRCLLLHLGIGPVASAISSAGTAIYTMNN